MREEWHSRGHDLPSRGQEPSDGEGLRAVVEGLLKGRSPVRAFEPVEPVEPVPDSIVNAACPYSTVTSAGWSSSCG